MTKELFIKCIDTIKKERERENKFLEGLDALSPDTYNSTFLYSRYEDILVQVLVEELDDKLGILPMWLYELDFGTKNATNSVFKDGKAVDLSTVEKLYNYLDKSGTVEDHTFIL